MTRIHSESVHESWSSRTGFLMAAIGGAVGLGNIWRFPYVAGESGGGAFVLIYLVCVFVIGVPLVMSEFLIGRRGGLSPINSMREVAIAEGRTGAWGLVGWMAVSAPMFGLMFYGVVGGWALAYIFETATGIFVGTDAAGSAVLFGDIKTDPLVMAAWHFLFMAATVYIVARGIRGGIEKAATWMMPALFVLLLILVAYAGVAGDFGRAAGFLFSFDFSKITVPVVLIAVGQAFFTLSLGGGGMMTYGAYLPESVPLPQVACIIALADTAVALLAGFAIFPIVFANGLIPGAGETLIFITLPVAFGQMPFGTLFGTLFFILLAMAAVTSSISMLEPIVSYLEEHKRLKRARMAVATGFALWMGGLGSVFSFNVWKDFYPLDFLKVFEGKTIFRILDYLTANILMTLGSIFVAVFTGWVLSKATTQEELGLGDGPLYRIWRFLVRFVVPIGVGYIFIDGVQG